MIAKRQQPMNPVDQRYSSQVVVDQMNCMVVVLLGQHPNSIVDTYADSFHSVVLPIVDNVIVDS
jgi:hypothetical protein